MKKLELPTGNLTYVFAEGNSEPCQTSKMERLGKMGNGQKLLTVLAKRTILDVWQGSDRSLHCI